jgi:glycosyltransferase domain-containing protein
MSLDNLNSHLLKKLTIVIPTYNRHAFMLRNMQYWSGKSVTVIYLDGSKKAIDPSFLTRIGTNIKYIHNPIGVCERILSSISFVVTEYVMLGCDDEFYIVSALKNCLIKLNSDPHFVTCFGRALGFGWYSNSVIGFNAYNKLKNLILDDQSSISRLRKHFSNYVPAHIYAITRSSIWKIAVKAIYSKEYNFYASVEIQMEFLLCYAGKSLVIPELLWLRSDECIPLHGTSDHTNPSRTFIKWWFDKDKEKEKNDFIARMENACRQFNELNKKNYIVDINNILETYIQSQKTFLFFRVYKYLPNSIRTIIKKIFKIFGNDLTKKTLLIDSAISLEATGVRVDFNELAVIEKKIISFYKNKKNFDLSLNVL